MTGRGTPEGQVFISYAREDSDDVDWLQGCLEDAGIPVWRDKSSISPGYNWRTEIRRAITDNTKVFIACFSSVSIARKKGYRNEEMTLAVEQLRQRSQGDPWLIPIRFDECDIPQIDLGAGQVLTDIQSVDLYGADWEDEYRRLVKAIRSQIGNPESLVVVPRRRTTTNDGGGSHRAAPERPATWAITVTAVISTLILAAAAVVGVTALFDGPSSTGAQNDALPPAVSGTPAATGHHGTDRKRRNESGRRFGPAASPDPTMRASPPVTAPASPRPPRHHNTPAPSQPPPPSQPPASTHSETVGGDTHTWSNYSDAGGTEGPTINAYTTVQIQCRRQGFAVHDGNTWWYQIASSPWSNNFYASADAFYNNGSTSGSLVGTPFYDPAVPRC